MSYRNAVVSGPAGYKSNLIASPSYLSKGEITRQEPSLEVDSANAEEELSSQSTRMKEVKNKEGEQNTNGQETNTLFHFGAGKADSQNKRGYRSSDLSPNFWKAMEITPPSAVGASRMVIIPMMIRKRWTTGEGTKHKILVNKVRRLNNAVMRIPITVHDTGTRTASKAKEAIISETALALHKTIKVGKDSQHPLTMWEDASWHFKWTASKQNGTAYCIGLAVMEMEANSETYFQKPGKQIWMNLIEDLESHINCREQGEIKFIPEETCVEMIDSATGIQDPSPPKPAFKKYKQGKSGGAEEPKTQTQPQEGGTDMVVGTENRVGREKTQREEEIPPVLIEELTDD